MPISEDEYDLHPGYEASSTMSKAELRKTHKPIMEKKRRARINHCLNEIKTLILEAMKKDPARHSKLEKADILEMTVKHLQNVQRQQLAMAMASDPGVLRKFKTGFSDCAEEVSRYINQLEGINTGIQQRVATHLSKCINGIEQIAQFNFPGFGSGPFSNNISTFFPSPSPNKTSDTSAGDQNNNPRIHLPQSLQLIPGRLPTGEFAFVVPNSSNLPYFSSICSANQSTSATDVNQGLLKEKSQRPSAFVTVIPSSIVSLQEYVSPVKHAKPISPPLSPSSSTSQGDDIILVKPPYSNTTSPRGFRPVNPTVHKPSYAISSSASVEEKCIDTDIAQITSTSGPCSPISFAQERKSFMQQTEVKSIKFPILSNIDKRHTSPKKIIEPLCIITNQSERYKQAQIKEESAQYEENIQRSVKRKCSEYLHQGLLTVASRDFSFPSSAKFMKTLHGSSPSNYMNTESPVNKEVGPKSGIEFNLRTKEESIAEQPVAKIDLTLQESVHQEVESGSHSEVYFHASSSKTNINTRESSATDSNDMWRPW